MHELKISPKAWAAVQQALISIDEVVGNKIAVTIILHDQKGGIYSQTDGPAGDLVVKFAGDDAGHD